MDQLGDKVAAKNLARRVGVPLIQDSDKDISDPEIAASEAAKIGYPVIIKAASGGGGRGMRVVRNEKDLRVEVVEAASEAETAFGDGTIFLEKFIENPHHIEFQIFGDSRGNIIHLGERDCSIQRRNQKLIEETPSPLIEHKHKDLRKKMSKAAKRIAELAHYTNAGTVEFIVDDQ